MVAAVVLDEFQVTELVKSCVLLFEKVPVAVNCTVVPVATEPFAGVTAIDTRVAAVTLRPVEPVMEPCLAEIVVDWPEVTPVASPAALMVAAVVLDELQVTELVKSCVLLSENVAVALNGVVTPAISEALAGVTAIAASAAPVTDTWTSAVSEPDEAWIVASPKPVPVANPVGLIVTTAGLEDVQVAVVKRSVPPLARFPMAEKRTVSPFGIVPSEGETEIDTSCEVFVVEPGARAQPARNSGLAPNKISAILTNEIFIVSLPVTIFACTPSCPTTTPRTQRAISGPYHCGC